MRNYEAYELNPEEYDRYNDEEWMKILKGENL